jgi:hypothetical protein
MAYQVNKFNGTLVTSVEDGTIDTTTDLRFIGKNYAGYGEVQNENFLHLLENFANTTAPPKVITGQVWFDSSTKKLKYYDGNKFKLAGGAEVSATAPAGLVAGEFWWDSTAKQLYTYNGTEFTLVGPQASPDLGTSAVLAQVVKDDIEVNHTIVQLISAGKVMAIVSKDEFTLNNVRNSITGFTRIKKGITLIDTNSTTGVTSNDNFFWGTSSDSRRLGGVEASNYLQKGSIVFDQEIKFNDPGFAVGNDNDFRLRIENEKDLILENRLGNDFTFRLTKVDGVDERDVAVITVDSTLGTQGAIIPGRDLTYDLGYSVSSTNKKVWNRIYAGTVFANVTGNVTGNITGGHTGNLVANDSTIMINATTKIIGYEGASLRGTLIGDVEGNVQGTADNATLLNSISPNSNLPSTPDKTSIPVRNSSGDITARKFLGDATNADKLLVSGTYRATSLAADVNTIAARTPNGDIFARLFDGTATAAQYADLAEKYLADKEYKVGTVVVVGGEKEVTECSWGQRAIGVVSANPAFMMNKDLEGGTYIALKGRVPVRVLGSVKKGDRLIAGNNGCAVPGIPHANDVFAIALESNVEVSEKLVEAVIL